MIEFLKATQIAGFRKVFEAFFNPHMRKWLAVPLSYIIMKEFPLVVSRVWIKFNLN